MKREILEHKVERDLAKKTEEIQEQKNKSNKGSLNNPLLNQTTFSPLITNSSSGASLHNNL